MRTPLGDFRVICRNVLEKIVGSERGKRKYPARRCHVCAAHKKQKKKKEVKPGTSSSSA